MPCFCSQEFFARVIDNKPPNVCLLIKKGIVRRCSAGVLLYRSLDNYFKFYLRPSSRRPKLQVAFERVAAMTAELTPPPAEFKSARRYRLYIAELEKYLSALEMLNRIGAVDSGEIEVAKTKLADARAAFTSLTESNRQKILAANIRPRQIETILLARYVDADTFATIGLDYNYSAPGVFLLHKRGMQALQSQI